MHPSRRSILKATAASTMLGGFGTQLPAGTIEADFARATQGARADDSLN